MCVIVGQGRRMRDEAVGKAEAGCTGDAEGGTQVERELSAQWK